jgi:Protein of unknown function (DUF5818)
MKSRNFVLIETHAPVSPFSMPRGNLHTIDGLMLEGTVYRVLRPDAVGEWRLDLPWRYRKMVNQCVRVEGTRSEFDMLDVTRVTLL